MIDDEEHTRALSLIGVYCGINIIPPRHGSHVWERFSCVD